MFDHSSSVFNNSCLKAPINPKNNQPLPIYEQKLLCQLENEAIKLNSLKKSNEMNSHKDHVKSFIEFIDSIPEYDDINHLPDKEFYRKLEMLKEKQKFYFEYLQNERKYDNKTAKWISDYKNCSVTEPYKKKKKSNIKPFCVTPILSKSTRSGKNVEDAESITLSEKDLFLKPPSRRSVRIESPSEKSAECSPSELFRRPKSRAHFSESSPKLTEEWEDLNEFKLDLDAISLQSKSAPNSPVKSKSNIGWKDNGITIPKPFEMTVRDEENKIVEELIATTKCKMSEGKTEKFKAHDIPIESQIPLFDKIMADQELKNQIVRERSKALLQAQMRPFSFTKRDEEIQKLTRELSKSSPSLFREDSPIKIKKFRAKPVPKNLFSNYIYKKMHEDEFYRALQKKIRAEEMLKAASLPPSMAKREKYNIKYDVCPRSFRDFINSTRDLKDVKTKQSFLFNDDNEMEFEELKKEFLNKKSWKKNASRKNNRSLSATNSESRTISSLDLQSVNRSNLAAVLRIQSARKRLEMEMARRLEEAKLKEEARWREKIMRRKPVWQELAFSHEEDLAMRLRLRKDEEKLRSEEHKLRMQLMLGRVNQQPTLFERQSQVKFPKCKYEVMDDLDQCKSQKKLYDLSEMSDFSMKDAAIQAFLDEEFEKHINIQGPKEDGKKDENESSNSTENDVES